MRFAHTHTHTHKENTIYFMRRWVEQPDDYSTFPITFQDKEYQLLPEVFFSIVMNEFKNKLERKYIIEETRNIAPIRDYMILERMRISLESIVLKNIYLKTFFYDYSEQGKQKIEIIEKSKEIEGYRKMNERAKELSETEDQRNELRMIDFQEEEMYKEEVIQMGIGR